MTEPLSPDSPSVERVLRELLAHGVYRCGEQGCSRPATMRVGRLSQPRCDEHFSAEAEAQREWDSLVKAQREWDSLVKVRPVRNADAIRMALVLLGELERCLANVQAELSRLNAAIDAELDADGDPPRAAPRKPGPRQRRPAPPRRNGTANISELTRRRAAKVLGE